MAYHPADSDVPGAKKEAAAGHGQTHSAKIFFAFWPQPSKEAIQKAACRARHRTSGGMVSPLFQRLVHSFRFSSRHPHFLSVS